MELGKHNPSNLREKATPEKTRIPMSLPTLRLAVPEIPGYHLHWFRGDAARLRRAQEGGYTFVEQDEVDLNSIGVADSIEAPAPGTDLGSRVSVYGGEEGGRLYLMKIKEEFWEEDERQKALNQERIAAQIRGDKGLVGPGDDTSNRYTKASNRNIFQPNRRA